MGMFDDIECKYPLPQPEDPKGFNGGIYFQTKDFECLLDIYEIREDGTLWLRKVEYEFEPNNDSTKFSKLHIPYKEKKSWWEPVNTTRNIKMYTYIHSETDYDYWIEYEVTFINGKLTKVNLSNFQVHLNSERKKLSEENNKKLKKWIEYTKTKKYKYIHRPYEMIIKFLFNKVFNLIENVKRCLTKLQRWLIKLL